jgi:hypothetical protein
MDSNKHRWEDSAAVQFFPIALPEKQISTAAVTVTTSGIVDATEPDDNSVFGQRNRTQGCHELDCSDVPARAAVLGALLNGVAELS